MTKKDFELIARTIRNINLPAKGRFRVALEFADTLEEEYPKFNRNKFMEACE